MKLLGFSNACWLENPAEYLELARLAESSPAGYVLKLDGLFQGHLRGAKFYLNVIKTQTERDVKKKVTVEVNSITP